MKTFFDFLKYLEKEKIERFTFKQLSEKLSIEFSIPKSKVILYCRMMKEFGMIKKKSIGGICESVCASCYEYGCTEPVQPPVNYWQIMTYELLLIS